MKQLSNLYKKSLKISGARMLVSFFVALPAYAQTTNTGLINPLNASSLPDLLKEVLAYAVQLGSLFLTIMLIYVGFLFVQARGNEEKVGQARAALMWTVIGGLILLGASALASVITSTISTL